MIKPDHQDFASFTNHFAGILHPHTRPHSHAVITDRNEDEAQQRQRDFYAALKDWHASTERIEMIAALRKQHRALRKIDHLVCFGLGSIHNTALRPRYRGSYRSVLTQLALFTDLAATVGNAYTWATLPDPPDLKLYAQDPAFQPSDQRLLCFLRISPSIQRIDQQRHIDGSSLFYTPHCPDAVPMEGVLTHSPPILVTDLHAKQIPPYEVSAQGKAIRHHIHRNYTMLDVPSWRQYSSDETGLALPAPKGKTQEWLTLCMMRVFVRNDLYLPH